MEVREVRKRAEYDQSRRMTLGFEASEADVAAAVAVEVGLGQE